METSTQTKQKTFLSRLCRHMGNRYVVHQVGLESAALAFYLIFAIFPFLILLSYLLHLFQPDLRLQLQNVDNLLPVEVTEIADLFLDYAAGSPQKKLVISALGVSFYFPMRAANSLILSVRKAYHLGAPRGFLFQTLKNLIYTVVLMVTMVLTVVLMTVSNQILDFAVQNLLLPAAAADLWASLRLPAVGVEGYFALCFIYALAQDSIPTWRDVWPGTMAALCGWLAASSGYAFYVNHIAHYSLLYGSIATVIVMLVWLNLTSAILILGAELNGALITLRHEQAREAGQETRPAGGSEPA